MAVKQRGSRDDAFARAVAAWQPRARVGLRLGEQRNDVREVWLDGVRCAGRLAVRSAGALDWEIALLLHLDRSGLRVPRPQPAADGRLRVGRLTVFSWLDGVPPTVPRDWQLVADELARLHAVTAGWPQRPDFLAAHDLLTHERGGDVRLDAMPADVVALCRAAWAALPATPRAVCPRRSRCGQHTSA